MRITGGVLRSRALVAPKGMDVRPTTDRVREALFSILVASRGTLEGVTVLDLFAGTGALGLEAVSRGARDVTFVEQDRAALRALEVNTGLASGLATTRVFSGDALGSSLRKRIMAMSYDLVFVDPPYRLYDEGASFEKLSSLLEALPLAPDGEVVVEHGKKQNPEFAGLERQSNRPYGDTHLSFFHRKG